LLQIFVNQNIEEYGKIHQTGVAGLHGAMKMKDYMEMTGLSHSVAAKEL
jgi:hypothetical protein